MVQSKRSPVSISIVVCIIVSIVVIGYFIAFMTYISDTDKIEAYDELQSLRMKTENLVKINHQQQLELKALQSLSSQKSSTHQDESSHTEVQHVLPSSGYRPGVIILGMHRSGTSALGGLVNKMGLKTGGPLIQAAEDNAKGFFERIDVVLQNDYLMQKQGVHYSHNTYKYDHLLGLKHILMDGIDGPLFKEGKRGLKFLNDPSSYPWMLKDPRLCITLRTWLPLLNFVPAILFTYRHPLDVALSLHKREFERFLINKGLRIWYIYNKRAIEQSQDLCRVTSSHRRVMQNPKTELDHVYERLKNCGVIVPHQLNSDEISSFIDIKLQHGQTTLIDKSCAEDLSTIKPPAKSWPTTDEEHVKLYREVMRVYCAMEDGSAFLPNFRWASWLKDD